MFGLTRREQRWKAEQAALQALAPVLVAAITQANTTIPAPEVAKPNLGCATTAELLDELLARSEVNGTIDYRTVDGA